MMTGSEVGWLIVLAFPSSPLQETFCVPPIFAAKTWNFSKRVFAFAMVTAQFDFVTINIIDSKTFR
jgi:hypothetical protein